MGTTITISGQSFEFTGIPSAVALKLATRVGKFVGPVLGKLGNLSDKNINLDVIGEILGSLNEDQLESFRKEFAEYSIWIDSEGNSKPLKNVAFFEQCFHGDVVFMIKWMIEFVKVNFLNGMNF